MTKKKEQTHNWYDLGRTLSHNTLTAMWYMVIGGRGIGKTYGSKLLMLKRYFKTGEQFIYMRRYNDDIKTSISTYFNKIKELDEFNEYELRTRGAGVDGFGYFQWRYKTNEVDEDGEPAQNKNKWQNMGFYFSLSNYNRIKSSEFNEVRTVLYDEFLIEKGASTYLVNEPFALMNVTDSIFRPGSKFENKGRVILMANAVTLINPYFDYFEINPDTTREFSTYQQDSIVVQFPTNQVRDVDNPDSKFSRLIAGTKYADYTIGNNFNDGTLEFVKKLPKSATYKYTIELDDVRFGVWVAGGDMFVSDKFNESGIAYSLNYDHMTQSVTAPKSYAITVLVRHAKYNKLYFTSPTIRETFKPLLNKNANRV